MPKRSIAKTITLMIFLMILATLLWALIFSFTTPGDSQDIIEPFNGASMVFGILTVALIGLIYSYNQARQLEASIGASQSNILVTEKRNHDLLDKANRLVDKHRQNEKDEILAFAKASSKEQTSSDKTPVQTKVETSSEFGQFIQTVPELQANQHVHRLLDEIIQSENNLQTYRLHHNKLVEQFNASIQQFPLILIKGLAHLNTKDYYIIPEPNPITDDMLGL
ncbi:LemA family protein [Vaginisenegalia massiliensis]|uniref:LemA family protein n=1 Tax=Vaginisenegalia massiliensis TaxID=2058294 RepID=UPI000F538B73|nr:LemA family protein [Vaginisenegalia massiliensis]